MQDLVSHLSANRVNRRDLALTVGQLACFGSYFPNNLVDLVIFEFVKYSVGSDQDVVQIIDSSLLVDNVRLASNHICHSSKVR